MVSLILLTLILAAIALQESGRHALAILAWLAAVAIGVALAPGDGPAAAPGPGRIAPGDGGGGDLPPPFTPGYPGFGPFGP